MKKAVAAVHLRCLAGVRLAVSLAVSLAIAASLERSRAASRRRVVEAGGNVRRASCRRYELDAW